MSACATQHGKSRAAARERDRTHFARVCLGKRRSGLDAMLAAVAGDDHACVPSCVSVTIRGFSAIASARPAFCAFERVPSGHEYVFLHHTISAAKTQLGSTNGISLQTNYCAFV